MLLREYFKYSFVVCKENKNNTSLMLQPSNIVYENPFFKDDDPSNISSSKRSRSIFGSDILMRMLIR